jgi:tRNA 5-methylaminomethyl-2-thiouridine biosynthesis bifunctional protein
VSEPVEWLADGTPRSARFDDIYRSSTDQAQDVFLRGCGLPQEWGGHAQWRILETGFGLGQNFLAAWRAWKLDPQRPRLLHFVSVEAWPVAAADIVRGADAQDDLKPLAGQLAAQWFELTPGAHRLSFEGGRVLLTLHVRDVNDMLRHERFSADSVFLDGFDPRCNPVMWSEATLKAMARHCRRGTRLATWCSAGDVRRTLQSFGFQVTKAEGIAPKRHRTEAVFDPRWEPKGFRPAPAAPSDAMVIGAGLAGAAVAASLARRGWRVTVVDAARDPASGASGLPVGLLAPNPSPDDNLLTRLSREGVRLALQHARELLREGEDWQPTAVLRKGYEGEQWLEHAAWIKPAALVRALLSQPGIEWRGGTHVDSLAAIDSKLIVVCAAQGSQSLLGDSITVNPVRGQVEWGLDRGAGFPASPVNGNGHFIPDVPTSEGVAWFCGSTYSRNDTDASLRADDTRTNLERLAALLPDVAAQVDASRMQSWAGVRCTSTDRRPLVGEVRPGVWASTAMGSRGLTFCILAAETIAARLHDEPLPVDARLVKAIDVAR